MDKRLLAKIKPAEATTAMVNLAGQDGVKFVVHAECHEDIFCLSFFEAERLRDGCTNPSIRTFFDKRDYITQDMLSSKRKWLTGCISSVTATSWWWDRVDGQFAMNESSAALIEERFPDDGKKKCWPQRIWSWQQAILSDRRRERYRKELIPTDEAMKQVPELPAGFEYWAGHEGMSRFNAIPYAYTKKKIVPAFCPVCEREMNLDKSITDVRRGNMASCPACGASGKLMPLSADFHPERWLDHWLSIIQRTEDGDGFIVRYFVADLHHIKKAGCWPKRSFHMYECLRQFYYPDGHGDWREKVYEYGQYKNQGRDRWIPYKGHRDPADTVLYTSNLPDVLSDTPWRYSALKELQKLSGNQTIHLPCYIREYRKHPVIEYLVKTGMVKFIGDLTGYYGSAHLDIDWDARDLAGLLRVGKPYVRILASMNGGLGELRLLKECEAKGLLPKPEEIDRWMDMFDGDSSLMHILLETGGTVSLTRFMNYIEAQAGLNEIRRRKVDYYGFAGHGRLETKAEAAHRAVRDRASDWADYIRNAKLLHMPLDDRYYILPPDLMKAHNEVIRETEKLKAKKDAAKQRRLDRKIAAIVKTMEGMKALEMHNDAFMIVVPKDGDEIRHEGTMLHHCVGTYVERVARGETMILFIRKVSEPDIPYYTIEWRDNMVKQLRGKHNSNPPAEVRAFAEAFGRKMKEEACGKKDSAFTTNRAS